MQPSMRFPTTARRLVFVVATFLLMNHGCASLNHDEMIPLLPSSNLLNTIMPSHDASMCNSLSIPYPSIYGLEFITRTAALVHNYSAPTYTENPAFLGDVSNLDFCNITLAYTHPGQHDLITVTITLPLKQNWNERFVAAGGGGFVTGYLGSQLGAVAEGYSSATTDGGHQNDNPKDRPLWALVSDGNLNYPLLYDFAFLALGEMVKIGKAVTASYYSSAPKYSYWAGCSTGGRQGLMIAQRYPKELDGIVAVAPATNWASFLVASYWPQQVMNRLGEYPQSCELDAITNAAVAACDSLDGVTDGVVSAPHLCQSNASTVVGKTITCKETGLEVTISSAAAKVAQASWAGARSVSGKFLWYGLTPSTSLPSGMVGTECNKDGTNCTGQPLIFPREWISIFMEKNPDFPIAEMSYDEYDSTFHTSVQQFESVMSANDPDLSAFRDAGGKMIMWHGLDDQLIMPNGSSAYYEAVERMDPTVRDYFRYFEAPGVMHCAEGNGFFPNSTFGALVDWVERGIAPETLHAETLFRTDGEMYHRPLCAYPLVARYIGGDPKKESSFACAETHV